MAFAFGKLVIYSAHCALLGRPILTSYTHRRPRWCHNTDRDLNSSSFAFISKLLKRGFPGNHWLESIIAIVTFPRIQQKYHPPTSLQLKWPFSVVCSTFKLQRTFFFGSSFNTMINKLADYLTAMVSPILSLTFFVSPHLSPRTPEGDCKLPPDLSWPPPGGDQPGGDRSTLCAPAAGYPQGHRWVPPRSNGNHRRLSGN